MRISAKVWYFLVYLIYFSFYVDEDAISKLMHKVDDLIPEVNDTLKRPNFIDKTLSFVELLSGCKPFNNTPRSFKKTPMLGNMRLVGISILGYRALRKSDDGDMKKAISAQTLEQLFNYANLLTIIKHRRLNGNASDEINKKLIGGWLPTKDQSTSLLRNLSPIAPISRKFNRLEFLAVNNRHHHHHHANKSLDSDHHDTVLVLVMVFHFEDDVSKQSITMNWNKWKNYIIIDEFTDDGCTDGLLHTYLDWIKSFDERALDMNPYTQIVLQFYLKAVSLIISYRGKIPLIFK